MIPKPVKVPAREITSSNVDSFAGGLFLGNPQSGPKNSFTKSRNIELDIHGLIGPRRRLSPFLPDTVETSYQKFPVLWGNDIYYFTADDGKIKFCQEGGSWVDCGGLNSFTTNNGGMCKFLRTLDHLLIINGKNGDKLAFVDLSTPGFPVIKFTPVADPVSAPTLTPANLPSGTNKFYYAFTWSTAVGSTAISPIATYSGSIIREQWASQTSPASIKITFPAGPAPAGATYKNLYIALSAPGGVPSAEDMLLLASEIDINTTEFVDDGTLAIIIGEIAPSTNSTDGPRVDQGITAEGNPILFDDQDNPYAIHIGGGGDNAMKFSVSYGGSTIEPEKGTNYFPSAIIGFRTGQGLPALTVLFSNVEGLSKQAVLQQQTVTYGNTSFKIWAVTEQYYGAAGVAAPNSSINYLGRLLFFSTDGIMSMETQQSTMNIISTKRVSSPVDRYIESVKNSAMHTIIGDGWDNQYMWLIPNNGFDTPQQILILDTNNPGINGDGAWVILDIPADWIGVVTPKDSPAIVYISQGNKTYKLLNWSGTFDLKDGAVPFATLAVGPWLPISGDSFNQWQASVQVMFYLTQMLGEATIGVNYKNQNHKIKTRKRLVKGPVVSLSGSGGWGDMGWQYAHYPNPSWGGFPIINQAAIDQAAIDIRKAVRIDDLTQEWQWFIQTDAGYNDYKARAISAEGINLGVRPDLA